MRMSEKWHDNSDNPSTSRRTDGGKNKYFSVIDLRPKDKMKNWEQIWLGLVPVYETYILFLPPSVRREVKGY